MSSKQELSDEIAAISADRRFWRSQARDAFAERDLARAERDEAREQLEDALHHLAARAGASEPRPFRVGDRVRVAEGATKKGAFDGERLKSRVQGADGVVEVVHRDGDLYVLSDGSARAGYVSPEFCTLIPSDGPALAWDTPADLDPAPTRQGVTLHLPDGTRVEIPCEGGKVVDDGSLWVASATDGAVAWVNPAAIVAAVVNR